MKYREDKIDPRIRKVVIALNKIGIPTTSSCQGHSTYGSPAPWIKITAKGEPRDKRAEAYEMWVEENLERRKLRLPPILWIATANKPTKAYEKWDSENLKLRKLVSGFLSEFYKNRRVPKDNRIVVEAARRSFWIHNGGEDYVKWREKGKAIVRMREAGEVVKSKPLSSAEVIKRKKKLPIYQKEMNAFAVFLDSKKNDQIRS